MPSWRGVDDHALLAAAGRLGVLLVVHLLKSGPLLRARRLSALLLLLVRAVLRGALVEELRVRLHEQLQDVESEPVHRAVPVLLRVLVQRADDDGEQLLPILIDQLYNVVVVPEEERALGDLEVRAGYAQRQPPEEHVLHAVELRRLGELEGLLELVQEEDLLGGDGDRPVAQHGGDDVVGEARVLLHVLGHAVGQLLVEGSQALHLVQWDQGLDQEVLVLILQGQREAVDDAPQDLEQLPDAVVSLALIDDLEEHVLDGTADEGAQGHELTVDAVQDGLQVVALPRILGVEELKQLQHEVLINKTLGDLGVHVVAHDEAQEKLVDDLEVRPGALQERLVVLRV
mmetsp:Transcript_39496/g.102232  ORF Transcript_39496/g.102232 Transcript_39496/m.102232 type:complete len:344 (+) Transcript_39496:133-1164(+)